MPPFCHQVTELTTGATAAPPSLLNITDLPKNAPMLAPCSAALTRSIHSTAAQHEAMNEAATAVIAISAPRLGRRLPKNRTSTNESAGKAGIIQTEFSITSALQLFDLVEVGTAEISVDQQDDGQPHAHFGRGDRNDE
ncbi:unannotated protein [freshwater metagenome]|uniref:Unannotated protein n=1 Tax=freshwater metagenome TaxID=449393 RepID=A0A6J7GJ99_9ZZZZ